MYYLYHYYYHFSLGKSGKIERISHNSLLTNDELQQWFNELIENKQIILGEKVEGFIRENKFETYLDYREYHDVDNNEFIEHKSFLQNV